MTGPDHPEAVARGSQGGAIRTRPGDGRVARGERSRDVVLRRAADIASSEGLDAISFGRLAADTGMSKAGVQSLFKAKEELQLAVIAYVRRLFRATVVDPATASPPGLPRLQALLEGWLVYADTPLLAGGCYRVANIGVFDGRPGPVRDALLQDQRAWRALLAAELREALERGEIGPIDPELGAFEIDAVLCAANSDIQFGEAGARDRVRQAVESIVRRTA